MKHPSAPHLGALNQRQQDGGKLRIEKHKEYFEINTGQRVSGSGDGLSLDSTEKSLAPSSFAPSLQVLIHFDEISTSL